MKKITLLISAIAFSFAGVLAQKSVATKTTTNFQRCSSTEAMQALRDLDPAAFDANQIQQEQALQDWIANNYDPAAKQAIVYIPVVVQIWENTSVVPDVRVTQQIARLNADFGRTNTDAGNTPGVFSAVDTEIQFCLATIDPSGNPTTGIIRRPAGGQAPSSGGTEMWDPTKYLNLYVYTIGGGTLGFAYPNGMQAVHIADGAFGNTSGPYNIGRTATHEVGHHFNLQHIWGGGCGNDDGVTDTPDQSGSNFSCPTHPSPSCSNSGDMFMNYMDYVNDNCMNAFTLGQKTRMWGSLNTVRVGLLTSSATNCTALPLTAAFSASTTVINAGQSVTFTDGSFGPNTITGWSWDFDVTAIGGVTPGTANTQGSHVVTYNTAGLFTVSLQATDNTAATDTETKTGYILVNPVGTVTCDSTLANWDWNSENYGAAYWAAESPVICAGGNSGAIVGNNCYDDNGWASKITFSQTGKELTDVLYVFVTSQGSAGAALKVWDDNGAGGSPNTVMYQQATTTGAYSGNLNTFVAMSVSPAVALNGNFFIGYDHNSTPVDGDSLVMGLALGTTGNQSWANETAGWIDLSAYGVDYKGTVVAVICDVSTGEKELLGEINNILVYPNPSVGTINIALTEKVNSTVSVFNMLGEEIFTNTKNTQLFTVDMNNQPNGVYFVKIKSGDIVTTKKVILSK